MKPLKERLSLIASMVTKGRSVCDVGTDHGYLPAFLYLTGASDKITATDIRQKPLCNAKENIERLGAKGVRLVLCDGLSGVNREDADNVIIAGMGGEVISGIIQRTPWIKDKDINIILQPMTASCELRRYLADNGFMVVREEAVADGKKIYSVMLVRFCGERYCLSDVQERIGLLMPTTPSARLYIEKQLGICQKALAQMAGRLEETEDYKEKLLLKQKLIEILENGNGT